MSGAVTAAAWVCFALIGFLTLGPAHFRPHIFHSTGLDRAAGFAVLGLLLGIAYPRHLLAVSVLVIGGAVVLEALQFLRPDRDARLIDLIAKAAGGALGIAAAAAVCRFAPELGRLWRRRGPKQG
jgi:VanZ family protein